MIEGRGADLELGEDFIPREPEIDEKKLRFNLEHMHKKLSIFSKKCDNIKRKDFIEQLYKLSQRSWNQLANRDKHELGYEMVLPDKRNKWNFKKDTPKRFKQDAIYIFRYSRNLSMAGIEDVNGVLVILFVEFNYGDYYDHS